MYTKYLVWKFLIIITFFFSWYYVICFCAIYSYSALSWLYGVIISSFLSIFISDFSMILIKFTFRSIIRLSNRSRKFENKRNSVINENNKINIKDKINENIDILLHHENRKNS